MKPEIELFRISPVYGKYYEYGEYTRSSGSYPNFRYFTNKTQYVGKLVKRTDGYFGENRWRSDYFIDENGHNTQLIYSFGGAHAFREVPCRDNWQERRSYIMLLEGTPPNNEDHIQKYVFDDVIIKAICTFIGSPGV